MSDTSQGPGWWQASDGKWYPPEQAPGAAPTTPPAGDPGAFGTPAPGYGTPPPYGTPPAYGAAPAGGGDATVGAAIGYGWKKFQEFVGPILIAALIYLVLVIALSFAGALVSAAFDGVFGQIVVTLVRVVAQSVFSIIVIRAALIIVDGKPLDTNALLSTDKLGPFVIASILFSLATWVGLILCVIPGIVIMFLGWYYGFFLLDKDLEPVDAIKASFEFTKENTGVLLPYALASVGLLIVGAIICCVGLLVAFPVTYIGAAYLFRRLQGQPVAA